jgi:CRP-like cAMP-binding protein
MATDGHAGQESDLSTSATRLRAYLQRRIEEDGAFYTKSRDIAEELDLSPKEIGAAMGQLRQTNAQPQIEKWGYTNGTTWRIRES